LKQLRLSTFGIKPELKTYWDYGSGELKYRPGIKPYVTSTLWKGGAAYARYDIPFYSNISTDVATVPDPVRSDSFKYLDNKPAVERLVFDQAFKLSERIFGRLSVGYLEAMYAGVGGEILTFLRDGDLALGIEGDWVRKRDPGTQLDLLDFETHTILGNIYYYIPGINVTLNAKYGRYLAGDVGWRFEVSREYENGVVIGFWYSLTDSDSLTGYNKGYDDKGVFLSLPARMFYSHETIVKYDYSISPWNRDVAGTVSHWQRLFDLGADLMPVRFKGNLEKIKE